MGVLKAKIDGAWVPLDTYATGPNPANALGIVAMGSFLDISTVQPGTTTLTNPINFTSIVGRRYRLCYQIRVISVTTGNGIQLNWTGSGVDIGGTDTWQSVPTGPYSYFSGGVMFDGTGVASSYTMRAYVTGATGVWLSPSTASYFYMEDMGPSSSPALPIPEVPPAWTPLTPLTPFANLGSYWAPLSYRKIGDVVSIRGVLYTTAVVNAATLIADLPAGISPPTGTSVITAQAMVVGASPTVPLLCRIDVRTNVNGLWWGLPTTTGSLAHVGINISYSVTP